MNRKTLTEIDFYRIRDEVAGFCISEEGKKSFLEREPFKDSKKISFYKNASREWASYFACTHNYPISRWEPIHPLFSIIKTNGASLSLEQVYALGQFCLSVKKVRDSVNHHYVDLHLNVLKNQIDLLPDGTEAEKLIFRVITQDGELRDLPEIVAIRKAIASLNGKIKNIMQTYTSDQKLAGVLESTVPVLRNGRQVLAVKASQQNRIHGIIHEVSQTAHTVYIEPEEAVICSNELIQKENELVQVIKRILIELTQELQPSIPFFKTALPLMEFLDTTFAASKWGIENNCIYADSCMAFDKSGNNLDEPPLLLKARHPLLGEKAVPIDIRFMTGKRVLIITGPNTGGKTVTLKTFALFAMLNQSGIPIPAAEGTRLPVFSNVFADIGDSQSMDMNLSTFSGHMKNIAEAVNGAKEDSLILLDELGSGTDPQEGTAISMAVLDHLIKRKSFVLVTTHQGVLKNYGFTNPCCINASVEFNQDTLSPSYHLLMGVPGESHALDIAERSGLSLNICKEARNYIATEQTDVSSLIRGLNEKHVELDKLQREYEKKEQQFEEKLDKLKTKELDIRRKEHELKAGKQQEIHDFLVHSRRQLENLVRTLKEGEVTREKTLGVKKYIADLESNTERLDAKIEAEEEKLQRAEEEYQKEKEHRKHAPSNKKTKKRMSNTEALAFATSFASEKTNRDSVSKNNGKEQSPEEKILRFEVGASVVAGRSGNQGEIVGQGKKGTWIVQFGSVRMTMKEKDLKLVENQSNSKASASVVVDLAGEMVNGVYIREKESERPVFELRLLGMRSDEAIKTLERQLDLCAINNFPHFSVIHGKGDGILQQVVRDYLSNCTMVQSFSYAPAEDGGAGKTYVELKN
ncbi:MAG: Smr/MutS family protein [Treponema sp.]|nr:Smr/MutS family protein [Treponema sp.]